MDDLVDVSIEDAYPCYPCYPAPPVDIKLFVSRIPKTYEEPELRRMFEEYGTVKEVIIIRDRNTFVHKCCAFVRMASISQADMAIRSLNSQYVIDTSLGAVQIKYAVGEPERLGFTSLVGEPGSNEAKLFVGSLPRTSDDDFIREIFAPFGNLEDVFIMRDSSTGSCKGCAFVKMAYKEQGLFAIRTLDGKRILSGCNRPMEVRFAETKSHSRNNNTSMSLRLPVMQPQYSHSMPNNSQPRQVGIWKEYISPEGRPYFYNEQTGHTQWERPPEFDQFSSTSPCGPPGANLFIFHIPNDWTYNDLVRTFSQFGRVLSAKIAYDKYTGRHRGYAFVSYDSPDAANYAVSRMNGYTIMGKRLKVTVKKGEERYVTNRLPLPPFTQHYGAYPRYEPY